MASNDLPDINSNLKSCLLTDSNNENNKVLKTVMISPTKTHNLQALTSVATSGILFSNKGNTVPGTNPYSFYNAISSFYGYVYLWSNTAVSGIPNITIFGLDNNYNEISETISLNSVNNGTPVQSVNQYRWVNKMVSNDRGSSTGVEVYCSRGNNIISQTICSQTFYVDYNAFFMVPRGYKARLTSLDSYGGTNTNSISVVKIPKQVSQDPVPICFLPGLPSGTSRVYNNGGGIGEFTEGEVVLFCQVTTTSTTSNISVTFTLFPLANYQ
jgi:hypothetical protein